MMNLASAYKVLTVIANIEFRQPSPVNALGAPSVMHHASAILQCSVLYAAHGLAAMQKLKQSRLGPDEDVRQVWHSLKGVLEELDQQCWSEDDSEVSPADRQERRAAHDVQLSNLQDDVQHDVNTSARSSEGHAGVLGPSTATLERAESRGRSAQASIPEGSALQAEPLPEGGHAPDADSSQAPVLVRLASVCQVVLQWGRSLVSSNLESLQFLLLRLQSAARQHKMFAGQLDSVRVELEAAVMQQYGGRISLRLNLST